MSYSRLPCENGDGNNVRQRMQTDICENVLENIHKRLPVRSLCRFRSVCKAWNTLFCSQSFITLHTTFNHNRCKPSYILKDKHRRRYSPSYPLYTEHQDGENFLTHLPSPIPKGTQDSSGLNVIGVIKGVVCLASVASTVFWNPATRKYIAVKNRMNKDCPFNIGFGYDAANKDFKAVTTALPWYDVFSIENATWRESTSANVVGGFRNAPWCGTSFANSTIYWIGIDTSVNMNNCNFVLLMFDCAREQFEIGELPHELIPHDIFVNPIYFSYEYHSSYSTPRPIRNNTDRSVIDFVKLGTYREKLSMQKQTLCNSNWWYEVWVMEGETKTWNKLVKVDRCICLVRIRNVVLIGEDVDGVHIWSTDEASSSPLCDQSCDHQQPLNGLVYEESLLLMDVKAASTFT